MKGLSTILDHKKWTFLYIVAIMSFTGMMTGDLEGVHFAAIVATLGTIVTTMSAGEKIKLGKDE